MAFFPFLGYEAFLTGVDGCCSTLCTLLAGDALPPKVAYNLAAEVVALWRTWSWSAMADMARAGFVCALGLEAEFIGLTEAVALFGVPTDGET